MKRLKILLQSNIFISLIFILCLGYVLFFTKVVKYKSLYDEDITNFEGIVLNYKIDGDKLSLELKAKEKIVASYYFKSLAEKEYWQDNIKLGIKMEINGTLNEALNNTIPNTFNYKKYLYNKKIYWTLTIANLAIKDNQTTFIYTVKNNIYQRIKNFSQNNSYMYAFVLGDKTYIDNETYNIFTENGVTHLFAVSGMHVGFLVGALIYILKKIHLKELVINIIIISFLIFYMFMINFSASIVRASLMYILLLINKKSKLKLESKKVLYLLFIFLLFINPFYIYDIAFIYSFMTSLGLIIFNKKIKGNYLQKLFLVSLIAFIFSLPITLYNNYEFNLLTVLNNIIIVPLISLVLFPLTLITFFLPFLNPLLNIGFNILEFINNFTYNMRLNIIIPKINLIFITLYYLGIYLIYKYNFKWIISIILLVMFYKLTPFLDSKAYIYYIDVGQGDATLIISEHFKDKILIDTGGSISYPKEEWQERKNAFNLADNLTTFFKSLGISSLDLLVITHGDTDHLGYANDILKEIKLKKIMLNNNAYNSKEEELRILAPEIKNYYMGNNLKIYNLNEDIYTDENDSSLVLDIFLNQKEFLIMGDAPKKVEKQIMAKYALNSLILKVGHHGSNTSSDIDFLKEVNPSYAIISAGRNNRYNHPSKETTESLHELLIPYYSTQDEGTIEVILSKGQEKFCFYPP